MSRSAAPLPAPLATLRSAVRARQWRIGGALFGAPAAAAVLLAWRYGGPAAAAPVGGIFLAAAALWMLGRERRCNRRWLTQRLNATVPEFEDSAELLTAPPPSAPLAALQRRRLQARLGAAALPDLRPAHPWRLYGVTWAVAAAALLLGVHGSAPLSRLMRAVAAQGGAAADSRGAGLRPDLTITPPAYTRLAPRHVAALDAAVPSGSTVTLALQLPPGVSAAALLVASGAAARTPPQTPPALALRQTGAVWQARLVVNDTLLYRLQTTGMPPPDPALHRIDATPDSPPQITVRAPLETLTNATAETKTWVLEFDVHDDYGLVAAQLEVGLAHGSGDNVKTTRRSFTFEELGNARERSYRKELVLSDFGFAQGDDLVAALVVADNRTPAPNIARSASYILRWAPPTAVAAEALEGAVQKVTPAYLRSERQIIIDSEALLAARPTLDAARFANRSDSLGVDQKMLRLRYGQFLGEEFENGRESAGDDGAASVEAQYGHVHDQPEAATLLDPEVKRILRAALDEMWQAELHLRQADPQGALPYAYKALEYIKQVQQSERIYLARARHDIPESDPARRLTGDRAALRDRQSPEPPVPAAQPALEAAWRRLQAGGVPDLAALRDGVRDSTDASGALDVVQSADRLQRTPDCGPCRTALASQLWRLMAVPPAAIERRAAADAVGAAYENALQGAAESPQ